MEDPIIQLSRSFHFVVVYEKKEIAITFDVRNIQRIYGMS